MFRQASARSLLPGMGMYVVVKKKTQWPTQHSSRSRCSTLLFAVLLLIYVVGAVSDRDIEDRGLEVPTQVETQVMRVVQSRELQEGEDDEDEEDVENSTKPTIPRPKTPLPTIPRPKTLRPTTPRPKTSRPTTRRPKTSRPTIRRPTITRPTRRPTNIEDRGLKVSTQVETQVKEGVVQRELQDGEDQKEDKDDENEEDFDNAEINEKDIDDKEVKEGEDEEDEEGEDEEDISPGLKPTTKPPSPRPMNLRPTNPGQVIVAPENPTNPVQIIVDLGNPTNPVQVIGAPGRLPTRGSICFSGETTVNVKDSRGIVFMKDLRLGDQVLVDDGKYEAVYSFGHRDETSEASFLRLLPSNLEISMDHMVKITGGQYVPASAAKVGDKLETTVAGEHITITGIETVVRKGVYAPFTMSGKIIVSDIKASNYVAFQDSGRLVMGEYTSPFSYQWLAHLSQGPHRIWVLAFGINEEETYTDIGMSTWIDGPHWLGKLFVVQHPVVMTVILVPLVLGLVVVSAIETVLAWVM